MESAVMNRYVNVLTKSALVLLALSWGSWSSAMNMEKVDAAVDQTLQAFYAQNPSHRELVNKSAGVLVFPRVTKAGVGVGGEHGEGALLINGTVVAHYLVSGASLGATIGVGKHSEIILFMTSEARDEFQRSHGWTVGADAGVAVASAGAGHEYDTETLKRPVLSFVLGEHGLIGDLSLEGAKITPIV
jgi:lipid-binding SYLF domain-containing protein